MSARNLLGFVLVLLCAYGLQRSLVTGHAHFLSVCPSPDVLQPDGNMRMIQALDRYQDLDEGRVGSFLISYFRANTWPPLRPTLSLLLFAFTGPSALADTHISFVFYILLFGALLWAAVDMSGSWLRGASVFLLVSLVLVHSREFITYAFASMLETQGMLFFALSVFFLFRVYRELYPDAEASIVGAGSLSRLTWWGLLVSGNGLLFTKYPYGIIFFMGFTAVEFLRAPGAYLDFARSALSRHYRGLRLVLLGLVVLIVAALILSGKFGYSGMNQKAAKNAMYLACLILFVDFNYYVYRFRAELAGSVPASMRYFYRLVMLPGLIWIFSFPDRFNSIIGGQLWKPPPELARAMESAGIELFRSSFFEVLFAHFTNHSVLVWVPLALGLLVAAGFAVSRFVGTSSGSSTMGGGFARLITILRDPLFSVTLLVWIQFVALEFSTANKQDRHIYHMLPGLFLVSVLWIVRVPTLVARSGVFFGRLAEWGIPAAVVGTSLATVLAPGGLFAGSHYDYKYRPYCFTGLENYFDKARWVAERIEPGRRYMIINFGVPPTQAVEREQTSEIDLLARVRAMQSGGAVRNDNRHLWSSWSGFDRLMVVSAVCRNSDGTLGDDPSGNRARAFEDQRRRVEKRAADVGTSLPEPTVQTHPSGFPCLWLYQLPSGP